MSLATLNNGHKTVKPGPIRVFERFGYGFSHVNGSDEVTADQCPWCGGSCMHLNIKTGLYHCKHASCKHSGNPSDFLTWIHNEYLNRTTDEHYRWLKEKRGIGIGTFKKYRLAFDAENDCWWIPFTSDNDTVCNIQLYYPNKETQPTKYNLPWLESRLFGQLPHDKKKWVFLCEGPFDVMALDYHLKTNRDKYQILGFPGSFKKEWARFFAGHKVRVLMDNDDGGNEHSKQLQELLGERASDLRLLQWPDEYPNGTDINDLVKDHPHVKILGFTNKNCVESIKTPKLVIHHGKRSAEEDKDIDWVWKDRLRCGTYCSFSGFRGTLKSTIATYLAARYSAGLRMPCCTGSSMPAGHVLYIFAEDDRVAVENAFELAGGNFDHLHTMPAQVRGGDRLNILEHLPELEHTITDYNIRFVIIDGQNSVVGTPNISTDMQARANISNKLHQFAQRLNICLLGVRNENQDGHAYGPASMGDIARCILRTEKVGTQKGQDYFRLVFERISDAAPKTHPPLDYTVEDLGGSSRKISWGKSIPQPLREKNHI